MSSIGTGYDLTSSQFSPDGRVFQIEYAAKAVENGGTVIGLRCDDGVVLAVEKMITNQLHEDTSQTRIHTIDGHIGMATGGLAADGNQLVALARREADNYREKFNVPIPIKELADRLAGYIHAYTLYSAVRPFGSSVILASYNELEGPKLYMIEPSGAVYGYFACAMGKAKEQAKTDIEKLTLRGSTVREMKNQASKIINVVHDPVKDKDFKLELSWVCRETGGKHKLIEGEDYRTAVEFGQNSDDGDDDE